MFKISIIASAYQAETFIQRYIDCVLNFDYKNIQFILINDGSTDKTHDIIENNRSKIKSKKIEFVYIHLSENKGQAYTLNMGLKYVTGDYLSWQDVDDIYYPNCLSRCLQALLENDSCKMVFSKSLIRDELTSDVDGQKYIPEGDFIHKNLFNDYIYGQNVIYGPLRFVETKALFKVLKDKSIYVTRGGQNIQLFLPMAYFYEWIYIDEVLTECVVLPTSHSRTITKKERIKTRFLTLINTIKKMDIPVLKKSYFYILCLHKILKKDYKIFRLNINIKKRLFKLHIFNKEIIDIKL